jgi:hypothetical protein
MKDPLKKKKNAMLPGDDQRALNAVICFCRKWLGKAVEWGRVHRQRAIATAPW